jgi:hypothetical protein
METNVIHPLRSINLDQLHQLRAQERFGGMAEASAILMNEALKLERAKFLQKRPCKQTDQLTG